MKAGLLQYGPVYLDVTQNLETVDGLVRNADFDLLVLPELFSTGYNFVSREDLLSVAEDPGDPAAQTISALKSWSSSTGATIVAGYAELADGLIYNSAAVVSNGELVGNYRKVHLFYREKNFFATGDRFSVFETTDRAGNSYRLGVMICFDWYFPEAARSLALQGADVIAHPSNLVRKDCPRSMPIRALENHVYTITSNRIGTEAASGEPLTFIGQSRACSPEGQVIAESDRFATELLTFEVEPGASRDRQITAMNHLFNDRRPDTYVGLFE